LRCFLAQYRDGVSTIISMASGADDRYPKDVVLGFWGSHVSARDFIRGLHMAVGSALAGVLSFIPSSLASEPTWGRSIGTVIGYLVSWQSAYRIGCFGDDLSCSLVPFHHASPRPSSNLSRKGRNCSGDAIHQRSQTEAHVSGHDESESTGEPESPRL
jgi:hypothetical protein